MLRHFTAKLKRFFKNHPLGILAGEVKSFVFNAPRELNKLERRFISLKPEGTLRGHVLLCYENKAFLLKPGERVPNDHTNRWEALEIAKTFRELGYQVDVIGENNDRFMPAKEYSVFVGNRINFDRIAKALTGNCLKILHIDTAHWLFNNTAEHQRLLALQQRRHVTLPARRSLKPNFAIEYADCATLLGNDFTISTYRYANKTMYRLPISAPMTYDWPEDKNFERSRKHFLWFGSAGFVHKGLDLVLEAFAETPEYHLTICGPLGKEKEFTRAYREMLYELPNIHTEGWVDVSSSRFVEISKRCIALIYPSCSESGGGSVINCMHAGLIPIVSREASVDVDGFGFTLMKCSIEAIKRAVQIVAGLPSEELEARARSSWDYARTHHTREIFAREYRKAISEIFTRFDTKEASLERTAISRSFAQPSSQPLES